MFTGRSLGGDPDGEVLDPSGIHIWYRVALRDMSGSVLLGIPQRCVLILAGCSTKEEFSRKHAAGEMNMPLFCHARVSRSVRTKDGASQPVAYVNHTLETVEPVSWAALSAPNVSQRAVQYTSSALYSFALGAACCGAL